MAKQVKTNAPGNAPGAGPVKTPAPTQRPPGSEKDFTFGRQSYGANAYGGPSSLTPGHKERASLTVNNDGDDPVMEAIKQHGVGAGGIDPMTGDTVTMAEGVAGTQVRKIAAKNVPGHPHMKDANTGGAPRGAVPANTGASNGTVARKPGA